MSRAVEACTAPRIPPLLATFTEAHILAITRAISR
jgi:hypothetical protein